jgi:hypothetical protein
MGIQTHRLTGHSNAPSGDWRCQTVDAEPPARCEYLPTAHRHRRFRTCVSREIMRQANFVGQRRMQRYRMRRHQERRHFLALCFGRSRAGARTNALFTKVRSSPPSVAMRPPRRGAFVDERRVVAGDGGGRVRTRNARPIPSDLWVHRPVPTCLHSACFPTSRCRSSTSVRVPGRVVRRRCGVSVWEGLHQL